MRSVQKKALPTGLSLLALLACLLPAAGCATSRPVVYVVPSAADAPMPHPHGDMVLLNDEELRELRKIEPPRMVWDIAETWRVILADDDGRWPQFKPVDTSAYRDSTDGVKGTIAASGEGVPGETYPNAFDNTLAKWCIKTPTIWIRFQYPDGVKRRVTAYTITTANDVPGRDPRDWKLLGSNDGEAWAVVDTRSGEKWFDRHEKRLFKVASPGDYNVYKLDVTKNGGEDTSQLGEIELLVPLE